MFVSSVESVPTQCHFGVNPVPLRRFASGAGPWMELCYTWDLRHRMHMWRTQGFPLHLCTSKVSKGQKLIDENTKSPPILRIWESNIPNLFQDCTRNSKKIQTPNLLEPASHFETLAGSTGQTCVANLRCQLALLAWPGINWQSLSRKPEQCRDARRLRWLRTQNTRRNAQSSAQQTEVVCSKWFRILHTFNHDKFMTIFMGSMSIQRLVSAERNNFRRKVLRGATPKRPLKWRHQNTSSDSILDGSQGKLQIEQKISKLRTWCMSFQWSAWPDPNRWLSYA